MKWSDVRRSKAARSALQDWEDAKARHEFIEAIKARTLGELYEPRPFLPVRPKDPAIHVE